MSSDILSANFNENANVQNARHCCIVDANAASGDRNQHLQKPADELITDDKSKDNSSTVCTDEEKGEEVFGNPSLLSTLPKSSQMPGLFRTFSGEICSYQLRFNSHNKSNNKNDDLPVQSEYDATIDERLPETVTLLTTPEGGKLYLVGTAHFSVESQKDVSMIIKAVQPKIVVVELCETRIGVINLNEEALYECATDLSFRTVLELLREYGTYNGLLHILLYRMVAHLVEQLGMPPGGEFRTAFQEAKKIPNCVIQLADRSINVTFQRTLRLLSWLEIIKLIWFVARLDARISKQDIERFKQKSTIDQLISSLKAHYPAIEKTFVNERDLYLTYQMQMAIAGKPNCKGPNTSRVVAVVGLGHINGIVENWGKVKASDIWPIIRVPPQPLSSKILKFTIKVSLLGAGLYVGYKVILLPSSSALRTIRSSVEGLLKADACSDQYEHPVPDVMYVVRNIPGPGVNLEEFESEYCQGCSCAASCSDSRSCSCTRGSPNYVHDRILDDKLLSGPIIECNSHCGCKDTCGNRAVQKGPLDSLRVSEIDRKGLGLFTTKRIEKGRFICEYAGEIIGIEEARRRTEANKGSMNYVLVVGEHIGDRVIVTCIDPKVFGNIGRYSNHSCEANASLVPVRVEGPVPRLCLFAIRDIEIGEEITFNYAGGVANSVHNLSATPCLCGSKYCSGYLPHNSI